MTLIDKAEALLPCPFCGSTMQVAMRDAMLCLECYAAGPQDEDRKTAWNRRALPARGVGVKPLDLSNALKHAFLSGVVAARDIEAGEPCVGADLWVEYDPTGEAAYNRILAALAPTDAAQARECCDLCGSDVTDMDGHLVHDEGCNGDTYAPAAQAREAALREAAAKATEHMNMHNGSDMNSYRATLGVRDAILALIGDART